MKCPYGRITEIGTTADIAVKIEATGLDALFSASGWALGNLVTDMASVDPKIAHQVRFQSDDVSMMMVDWLSELLYIFETRKLLFSKFDITITDTWFSAGLHGDRVSKTTHVFRCDIKAVTWHGLSVEKTNGVYTARILFDI
jgi:SHS2 domain-containing protein